MKKFQNSKIFGYALLLIAVAAVCFIDNALEWLFAGGGLALATNPVVGAVTTGDEPEMNTNDISKSLVKIYPDKFPLDTMLREIGTVKCKSFEYEYFSMTGRKFSTTISTAFTTDSDETLQTISVTDVRIFSIDSNVAFPEYKVASGVATKLTSGVTMNSSMVCHIVALDLTAKTITLQPVNVTAIPSMAVGTTIMRIGTAKNEKAAMSEDPITLPVKDSNYCQIHMATISEGLYQKMTKKDVEFGLADFQEQAIFDFRAQNEAASFFGAKLKLIDQLSGELKYLSGGIARQITKELEASTSGKITQEDISGWMTDIFSGNNGSDRRIMFCGSKFGEALESSDFYQRQLGAMQSEMVLGVKCNVIKSTQGELAIKRSPIFAEFGYEDYAIVIDPANIYRAVFKPLEEQELELDKTGVSRVNARRIDETHCVVLQNLDTHAIISIA